MNQEQNISAPRETSPEETNQQPSQSPELVTTATDTTDMLKRRINDLALHRETSSYDVNELYFRVQYELDRMKAVKKALDEALIPWLQHNGDLEIGGGKRLYAGTRKTTKLIDKTGCLHLLLSKCADDKELASVLSSNAFLHGAAKNFLTPAEWDSVFETTKEPAVKDGVSSNLKVLTANDNFAK
jgi:hypothetical protein